MKDVPEDLKRIKAPKALDEFLDKISEDILAENARLRAELEERTYHDDRDSIIAELEADLETLRPKPVVTYKYMMFVDGQWSAVLDKPTAHTNLKLTFRDGVLVAAEVI